MWNTGQYIYIFRILYDKMCGTIYFGEGWMWEVVYTFIYLSMSSNYCLLTLYFYLFISSNYQWTVFTLLCLYLSSLIIIICSCCTVLYVHACLLLNSLFLSSMYHLLCLLHVHACILLCIAFLSPRYHFIICHALYNLNYMCLLINIPI